MPDTVTHLNSLARSHQRAKLFSLFGQSKAQKPYSREKVLSETVAASLIETACNSFNTRPKLPFVARLILRASAKSGGYHKFL